MSNVLFGSFAISGPSAGTLLAPLAIIALLGLGLAWQLWQARAERMEGRLRHNLRPAVSGTEDNLPLLAAVNPLHTPPLCSSAAFYFQRGHLKAWPARGAGAPTTETNLKRRVDELRADKAMSLARWRLRRVGGGAPDETCVGGGAARGPGRGVRPEGGGGKMNQRGAGQAGGRIWLLPGGAGEILLPACPARPASSCHASPPRPCAVSAAWSMPRVRPNRPAAAARGDSRLASASVHRSPNPNQPHPPAASSSPAQLQPAAPVPAPAQAPAPAPAPTPASAPAPGCRLQQPPRRPGGSSTLASLPPGASASASAPAPAPRPSDWTTCIAPDGSAYFCGPVENGSAYSTYFNPATGKTSWHRRVLGDDAPQAERASAFPPVQRLSSSTRRASSSPAERRAEARRQKVEAQAAEAETAAAAANELVAREATVAEPVGQTGAASKVKVVRVRLWALVPLLSEPDLRAAAQHAADAADSAEGTDSAISSSEHSLERSHGQSQENLLEAAATPGLTHHAAPCASPHAAPRARVRVASWRTVAGGGAQLDLPLLSLSNLPPPAPRSSRAELRQGRRIERLAQVAVEHLLEQLRPWLTQPPQYSFSIESIPDIMLEVGGEASPTDRLITHSSASLACCNSSEGEGWHVAGAGTWQALNLDGSTSMARSPSPSPSASRSPSPTRSPSRSPLRSPSRASRSHSSSSRSSPRLQSRPLRGAKAGRGDFCKRTLGRYEA